MLTIFFIFLVAAANLAIGFAGAVYLGMGPKQWPPAHEPEEETPEPVVEEVIEEVIEEEEEEPPPTPTPQIEFPQIDAQQQPLVALVQQLSRGIDHFEAELADWDSGRRESGVDEEALANASVELHGLTTAYVAHFQAAIEPLAALQPATPQIGTARDSVSASIGELAAQLNQVSADLQPTSDKLTTALIQVLSVLHAARDKMEEPLVALLEEQLADEGLVTLARQSSFASLLGRFSVEHAARTAEKNTAAMIDVDSLRQLNAAHGPHIARRTLAALDELTRSILPAGSTVARLSGKQFLLWLPNLDAEAAVQTIETLRQEIEQARLRSGSKQLQITVSASVLALAGGDTALSALEHLRAGIREAKSHGQNRTYVWQAGGSTAVDPPKLAIQARSINL
jgi:diguanylate cyclase (GGDEF)-like protein